jgi:hypothetical protein
MWKLTVALLAIAVVGSASAAGKIGWRTLQVDGSSEAGFTASVAEFKDKLSPARYQVFLMALKDVWELGAKTAEDAQREYAASDYLDLMDGLDYEQVVTLTDPTGDTAKARYRTASAAFMRSRGPVRDGYRPWHAPNASGTPIRGLPAGQTPQQANALCGGCYPL